MRRATIFSLAALLASCGGGESGDGGGGGAAGGPSEGGTVTVDGTVDCIAMMVGANETTLSSLTWAYTWAPLAGDGESHIGKFYGDSTPKRCTMVFREGSQFKAGGVIGLHKPIDQDFVASFSFPKNAAVVAINYQGKEYVASEGSVSFDSYEAGKAAGTYDGYFALDDGAIGHFSGKFDFCSYGVRRDCPYNVVGAFAQKATVTSMSVNAADAEPGACRVLVDRATGGLQLDLDLAIWRKMSVTQLYTAGCDPGNQSGLNANRLTFKSGGWKGPGHYGPFKSVKVADADPDASTGELWLPSLAWTSPASFSDLLTFDNPGAYCLWQKQLLSYENAYKGYSTANSQCEYTITESPGHVDLTCTKVWHYTRFFSDWATRLGNDDIPPLTLSSDCDVVYKN